MPRISHRLLRHAQRIDKFLPPLLPVCRDLGSAQNELRWLKEHAEASAGDPRRAERTLFQYVSRRSRNEPLQYIVGSEFFGELEIKCRAGVLIPRQETAASVSYLVQLLSRRRHNVLFPNTLRVIDLCTGSGCIPLLFHHDFYSTPVNQNAALNIVGVDISKDALKLARENQILQLPSQRTGDTFAIESLRSMAFFRADILQPDALTDEIRQPSLAQALGTSSGRICDVLISNPPYISSFGYHRTTERSVRQYEPKLALVPHDSGNIQRSSTSRSQDGDIFYPRLLEIAKTLKSKVFLFEVGDMDQAGRVAALATEQAIWDRVEIWRDYPDISRDCVSVSDNVIVRGQGHGRSVFGCRQEASEWLELD